ncbi:MAG: hypothetical protein ACXABG_06850, partial [Promethearchaeota archaeon]
PSIEFFPGETAPQEHFLIDKGFPLIHIKDCKEIVKKSIDIISSKPNTDRFNYSFKEKLKKFENPNNICFKFVMEHLIN